MTEKIQYSSESILRHVVDEIPEVFIIKDWDGNFVLCNKVVADLYKTTPEEMIGKDDSHFGVPKDMNDFFRESCQSVIKSGQTQIVYEDTVDASTGETRHFKSVKKPIKDSDGNDLIIIIAQDVTDIIQGQNKAKEKEGRLKSILSILHEGVWDWHLPTGELNHNSEWFKQLGIPEDSKGSMENFEKHLHPEDKDMVFQRIDALLSGQTDLYESHHRMLKSDGSVIHVFDRGAIIERDKDGTPTRVVGSFSNITDDLKAREEILSAKNEAEKANKAKSEFLSSMSHELRTPLNSIIGFTQLLQRAASENLTDKQRSHLKLIHEAGQHLLNLVEDVLDLSKIETQEIEAKIEKTTCKDLIQECLDLASIEISEKGLSLSEKLFEMPDFVIEVDKVKFKQVIMNILSNAIKYNSNAGEIRVSGAQVGDFFRLVIEDTGIGIPFESRESIFEPFNRLGKENGDIEGTGIGLTISKNLIEHMGGSIGVESQEGKGSTFWVDVPLADGDRS